MREMFINLPMVITSLFIVAIIIHMVMDMVCQRRGVKSESGGGRQPTVPDEMPSEEGTIVFPSNGEIHYYLKPKGGNDKLSLNADAALVVKGRKEGYVLLVCTKNGHDLLSIFPVGGEAVVTEAELDDLKRFAKQRWAEADEEQHRRRAEKMF